MQDWPTESKNGPLVSPRNGMDAELFNQELVAMHLHEQDYFAEKPRGYGDYPLWFRLKADERRKYRLRAQVMIQEAREPRG